MNSGLERTREKPVRAVQARWHERRARPSFWLEKPVSQQPALLLRKDADAARTTSGIHERYDDATNPGVAGWASSEI